MPWRDCPKVCALIPIWFIVFVPLYDCRRFTLPVWPFRTEIIMSLDVVDNTLYELVCFKYTSALSLSYTLPLCPLYRHPSLFQSPYGCSAEVEVSEPERWWLSCCHYRIRTWWVTRQITHRLRRERSSTGPPDDCSTSDMYTRSLLGYRQWQKLVIKLIELQIGGETGTILWARDESIPLDPTLWSLVCSPPPPTGDVSYLSKLWWDTLLLTGKQC